MSAPVTPLSRPGPPLRVRAGTWDPSRAAALVSTFSVALVALAAVVSAILPLASWGPALLVVAGLVGLPHGAVDHLALGWARGSTRSARPRVLVAYAAAAVVAAAAALLAPLPALLVLLVLSAAHFGEGEAAFDRLRGGTGPALPAAAMGTAVVAMPLTLHPAQARPLLASLDPRLPHVLAAAARPLLALTTLLVVAGLLSAWRGGQRRAAGELAVVVAAAALGPPLVVFACWFSGWHAPRHLVRLAALEPAGDGPERLRRLARGAAAPTAVAVLGLVALALLLHGLPGAVLIVLLALTVPHAAVVARLDRIRASAGPRP